MRFRPARVGRDALIVVVLLLAPCLPVSPLAVSPTGLVSGAEAAVLHSQAEGLEPTIEELVVIVQYLRGAERTRELLGIVDPEGTDAASRAEHELRARVFWDVVFPHLLEGERDCSFGEAALGEALNWARQVQLGEPEAWKEEVDVINESMLKIALNCHDELYKLCILDDRPPLPEAIASVNRNLFLLGAEEPIHVDHKDKCFAGWGGTLTVTESLDAAGSSWSETSAEGPTSGYWNASGSYEMRIELHARQGTGSSNGSLTETNGATITVRRIEAGGTCTSSNEGKRTSSGNGGGQALFRPLGTADGQFKITFDGPTENRTARDESTRTGGSCPSSGNRPPESRNLPTGRRSGEAVVRTDPYSERLNGEVIDIFTYGPTGFGAVFPDSGRPWLGSLGAIEPLKRPPEPPRIMAKIRYDLTFGG